MASNAVRPATRRSAGDADRISSLKQRIAAVANRLFTEQGFDETTMAQIAESAGVSRRSLFRYFASKDDLVFASIDLEEGAFVREFLRAGADSDTPVERLKAAFRALAAKEEANAATVRSRVRVILDRPMLAMRLQHELAVWQAQFDSLMATGTKTAEADLQRRVQVAAINLAYFLAVSSWIEDSSRSLCSWLDIAFSGLDGIGGEAERP